VRDHPRKGRKNNIQEEKFAYFLLFLLLRFVAYIVLPRWFIVVVAAEAAAAEVMPLVVGVALLPMGVTVVWPFVRSAELLRPALAATLLRCCSVFEYWACRDVWLRWE